MDTSQVACMWIGAAVSGLVGSVIGGTVAYLTNRQQLRHASKEARAAREHALRREVYFEAADAVGRGVEFLSGFGRIDVTLQQASDGLRGNHGWANKVHVIADLDTIRALDRATEFLFSSSLDLMAKRLKLDTLRSAAAAVEEQIAQAGAHAQQLVAALQAVSAPDATNEARTLAPQLTQKLLDAQGMLLNLAREHDQAVRRQHHAHRRLVMDCMKAIVDYQRLLGEVNVHVRRELGLPLNEKDYLEHTSQTSDRVLAGLKTIIDQLDSE